MRKKLIIIGIIVLIIGIAVSEIVTNVVSPPISSENLTITANGYNYMQFNFSNSLALFVFYAQFKDPLDVYIMNSTAFSAWESSLNKTIPPNGFVSAISLEGNGVAGIYKNMSTYMLSYPVNYTNNTVYIDKNLTTSNSTSGNLSIEDSNATYFIVFNNMNGNVSNTSPNEAYIKYIPPLTLSNIQSDHKVVNYIYISGSSLMAALVLVIAGIIVIVIGIIKKPKALPFEVPEVSGKASAHMGKLDRKVRERDELYKSITDKKPKKKSNE